MQECLQAVSLIVNCIIQMSKALPSAIVMAELVFCMIPAIDIVHHNIRHVQACQSHHNSGVQRVFLFFELRCFRVLFRCGKLLRSL